MDKPAAKAKYITFKIRQQRAEQRAEKKLQPHVKLKLCSQRRLQYPYSSDPVVPSDL